MDVLKLFLLCLLPLAAFSQDASFVSHPVDTLVQVDNEVVFDCVFENVGEGFVSWYKGADILYRGSAADPDLYKPDDFAACCELSGDASSGDFSLRIKQATYDDSMAWKCSYTGGGQIMEEHGVLTVLDPLDCEVVDGAGTQNDAGSYQVIEGNTKEMRCMADGTPPAVLVWTKDAVDSEVSGNSPLSWEPTFMDEDTDAVFDCQLRHETLAEPITCAESISFDVQFKPILKVDINADNKDGKVIEGKSFTAACMVVRAKPEVTGAGPTWSTTVEGALLDGTNLLALDAVTRSQAGDYVCSAENTFFDGSVGKSEETVSLDVQYPPVLILEETRTVKVGEQVTIDCAEGVTEANPAPTEFRWIRFNSDYQTAPALQIDSVTKDDKGMYSCEATSVFYDGTPEKATANVELLVEYKPEVTVSSPVALKVGDSRDIECNVDANPAAETVQWFKLPDTDTPVSETSTLSITDATMESAGQYKCQAKNTFYDGEGAVNDENNGIVEVLVQFMSDVTLSGPTAAVTEGAKQIVLNCSVESVPEPYLYKWEFVNKEGVTETLSETSDTLNLGMASRTHAGTYTCTATTMFYDGEEETKTSESLDVSVKYKPDITNKEDKMVAVEIGASAKLVCLASAIPDPVFSWINSTGGEIKNVENKYTIEEKYEMGVFENTLTIMDIVQADYASYECQAVNDIGVDSLSIELSPVTVPEKPVDVTVVSTHHSLEITWKAGFNGGSKQSFVVELVNKRNQQTEKADPIPEDGSEIYQHLFTGLDANGEYVIRVTATNPKGASETEEYSAKTEVPPKEGKAAKSGATTVIIVVVIIILLLIIVIIVVVIIVLRRRKSNTYNTQKGEQVAKPLDEEVPLNATENENEKGVSEFALDENEKNKSKDDEETQPLKDNEEGADTKDEPVNAPRPDEPPFMINGSSPEKEAPEETKIEDEPEAEKSPADEKVSDEAKEPETEPAQE